MGGLAGSQAPHIIYREALGLCARRFLGVAALGAGVAGAHVEQVVAVNGLAY